ncbi:hypothetical protein [Rothia aeria]|uniref:hypothetical protein n=1 Tax=Rothia aeria TaxID=172042 RepID=UPI0028D5036E|nr:hypothetical protein [Rothia aeria]
MSTPGFPQNPYMGVPPQVPPTAAVPYGPSAQKPNTIYIVFYWLRFIVHAAHIGFWIFIVATLRSGSTDFEQGLGMVIGTMLLISGVPYIVYIILQIIGASMYQRGKFFGLVMGINIYGAVLAGIPVFFLFYLGIESGAVELMSGGLIFLAWAVVCILYSVNCARHMQDIKRQREHQRLTMQQAAAAYPAYGGGMVPQYTQIGYEQRPPYYYQ